MGLRDQSGGKETCLNGYLWDHSYFVKHMRDSHPTLSQRIDVIEKIETEAANGN